MRKFIITPILILCIMLPLSGPALADTYHVPDDFLTIQAALDATADGDTVIVRDGIYSGPGNRNIDFNGKGITLRSQNGPADCVINCEKGGRAFLFNKGETSTSLVDGFKITEGYVFGGGGAIYCYKSSPAIVNCIITGNSASGFGGALAFTSFSSPIIDNCEISDNSTDLGGAIYCSTSCSPNISKCTISKNSATLGGAVYSRASSPTIINCILWDDSAPTGPEIALTGTSSLTIDFSAVGGGQSVVYTADGSVFTWGTNNVDIAPVFVDAKENKFRLAYGSPCINSGTIDGSTTDGTTDMGAYPAVTVDDDPGQDHSRIGDALHDPAFDDNRGGSIAVYPGNYPEDISMKDKTDLSGAGPQLSVIEPPNGISCVGIRESYITGFTIRTAVDAITLSNSSPVILNNVFTDCLGSAVDCGASSSPLIMNNTIENPSADGIVVRADASPVIANNIIMGVRHGINTLEGGIPVIDYNNIYDTVQEAYWGCAAGPHDISVDPMFEDPANNDYHLQMCSPCIDAGDAVESLTVDYIAASLEIYVNEITNISPGDSVWITDGANTERGKVAGLAAGIIYVETGFENGYSVSDNSRIYSRYSDYSRETEPDGGRINMGAYGNTPNAITSEFVTDDDGDTYSECHGDCDDASAQVNPGADEICNGIDDDCDDLIDIEDDDCIGFVTYYRDDDQDGYGVDGDTRELCQPDFPYTALAGGDCDDADDQLSPGVTEVCNGIDDDCDELIDADDDNCVDAVDYYKDEDQDEYGADGDARRLCAPEFPYTALVDGDCDDADAQVNPEAQEVCNGIDDDCDDLLDDEDDCIGVTGYYRDDDQDGYGVDDDIRLLCDPELPYTALVGGDCDDNSGTVFPGAPEVACDGIDQDCDEEDPCSCQLSVEDVAVSPDYLVQIPVHIETACGDVDALGFDFDYTACQVPGYVSFTGNYVRGDLTANWDFFDVSEIAPGVVRVGGFTVEEAILQGESGAIVDLEFEILDCQPDDICSNTLTNLVSDIYSWPVVPGTFTCDCPPDGDVDGDGQVTPGDALLAFQHYLVLVQLTQCETKHADIDADGQPTPADSLCIFQCYLGIPCPDLCP